MYVRMCRYGVTTEYGVYYVHLVCKQCTLYVYDLSGNAKTHWFPTSVNLVCFIQRQTQIHGVSGYAFSS